MHVCKPTGLNNQMLVASTDGSHAGADVTIKRMLVTVVIRREDGGPVSAPRY